MTAVSEANGRVPGVEARAGKFPGPSLIPSLHAIQRDHGWLPREELVRLSRETRRPLYEIEGLVSFYPHFRTEPPPEHEVLVCRDLSCRLARDRASLPEGAVVREVSCLGQCDWAPVAIVDGHFPPARRGEARRPNDPYASESEHYRVLREFSGDPIAVLKDAGLRGMGGAGFPTGTKWEMVRSQADPVKYVICNADEAEPGTFKDRQIIAEQPHLLLEGMLLAMRCVGAEQGWVFIRHEFEHQEDVLRAELERARAAGVMGGAEIGVFTSPGGYILGEETALLECMEGHRGEPRNKPPFPGGYGLHGRPTLMNNVETLADIPIILERGADWWNAQGVNGGAGFKFFSVSGHVVWPGVYCVPSGTTIGDVIELAGGVRDGAPLGAVQPGGASTNFLGPDCWDVPLTFDAVEEAGSALGTGAMIVLAEGTDLLAAATNVLRFFRNESCGKCVPCRVGSTKAHEILVDVLESGGSAADVDERIDELEETLRLTSICGLGQVALGPVMSVLRMQREHV
jgi:NADH:ubiquinone oxidoreductase subunit F (NADH-binding)